MTRLAARHAVAARLSELTDAQLHAAVAAAEPLGTGIGGRRARLDVGGTPVFVKRVPLTDVEHARSTANVFKLPTYYQYGVGSAGFGAWRELAAHTMTTRWVLDGKYDGFPLTYHWRVLPDLPPEGFVDEFGGIEGAVAHWAGSHAVRARLEAIGRATSSIVLFMEYVPRTLGDLFHAGEPTEWVERALARGTEFMSAHGMVHFDAHFDNILTDGQRLYFADFGLASSTRFDLTSAEAAFLSRHRAYDHCWTTSQLLHQSLDHRDGFLDGFLGDWLAGRAPRDVPPETAAVIDRHAATTAIIDRFHRRLVRESRKTPFPAAEIERALSAGST